MPDFECTWWPDVWFGHSLTEFCIAHDLGGTDLQLAQDVAGLGGGFIALGAVMYVGLKLFGQFYRAWKKRNN